MNLEQILDVIDGQAISNGADLSIEVEMACGADLMSDVLAFAKAGSMLLTGLTNTQVVRIANVLDIAAIIIVRGKKLPAETVELAKELHIPVLSTKFILFETAGRLYAQGIVGCLEKVEK